MSGEQDSDWFRNEAAAQGRLIRALLANERANTAHWRSVAIALAEAFGPFEHLWDENSSEKWNRSSQAARRRAMDEFRRLVP